MDTDTKTGFFEEAPGCFSMGRLMSFLLVCCGIGQIACGSYVLITVSSVPLAGAAWTAGLGTIGTGLGSKYAAKKQEDAAK